MSDDDADGSNGDATGDVSPDDAERHPEFYDMMEQRSRHRVISNGGGSL